jgi:hypothetical protein
MPQDKEKYIKVTDNRKTNIVTGKPLSSKARKHAEIPYDTVESIIFNARKHGVDPARALAIGLQETGYKKENQHNPFMLGNYNPYGDIIDESMKFMATKNKEAKRLGKKTEEEEIQVYNGTGPLKDKGLMYGIDTNKNPINTLENPVYGKTVKQLRDSVIMQNPEILKLINMGNKGSVPKLKCGGKKTRKMADGGINKVPTMQSSQLATKFAQANNLPQKALAENGLAKSTLGGVSGSSGIGANGGAIMAGADLLSDTVTGALETRKQDYTDNRINPEESMRKNANLDVAGDITKTTLKGAAAGTAIMPGLGTIIGAGVGLVGSGLKNILGSKKRQAERAEAKDEWSSNWLNSSVKGLSTQSYKNGGMKPLMTNMPKSMAQGGRITGAGGPKEDKITKKIEDGSFIVPTENGEKALELGRQYLGWEDGENANRNYPGTEVKVSDGEVLFTPEEVSILSYNGVDVDSLAPNSNEKLEKGMATGGYKYNNASGTYEWDETAAGDDPGYGSDTKTEVNSPPAMQSAQASSVPIKPVTTEEPESMFDKLANYLSEVAGALQIDASIDGSRKAGAMPDVNVSQYLKDLATEQRKDAQYGLEPGAKSAMLSSIERDKRNTNNAIVNRGGTAGEVMSNLQGTLSTGIDKSLQIELSDAAEKARKKGVYAGTVGQLAGQDFDSKRVALENWMQWQDVNAGLLNAGISNIVGVRKLRAELDAMKKIGNNKVDFSSLIPKG